MEDKKSYYAIIPAIVRYDSDLTPNAKLLYGEITALCNDTGCCWASNDYFAKLYGVSKVSISKWISMLIKKNYIYSEFEYKEGTKKIEHRFLKLKDVPIKEKFNTPLTKVNDPNKEKFNTPIKEKLKDNNTIYNNTFNNKEIYKESTSQHFKKPSIEEIQSYIAEKGYNDVDAESFYYYYDSKQWFVGKGKMKNWKSAVSGWHARNKRSCNNVRGSVQSNGEEYAFLG